MWIHVLSKNYGNIHVCKLMWIRDGIIAYLYSHFVILTQIDSILTGSLIIF